MSWFGPCKWWYEGWFKKGAALQNLKTKAELSATSFSWWKWCRKFIHFSLWWRGCQWGNEYDWGWNRWRDYLTHFVVHYLTNRDKIKIKVKKFGKMSLIFEFSISKLGYMEIFMKIWEKNKIKNLFHYLTLTICLKKIGKKLIPKLKIRIKIFGRMNLISEFFISKLGYMTIFMKIWEEKIWPIL